MHQNKSEFPLHTHQPLHNTTYTLALVLLLVHHLLHIVPLIFQHIHALLILHVQFHRLPIAAVLRDNCVALLNRLGELIQTDRHLANGNCQNASEWARPAISDRIETQIPQSAFKTVPAP